MAITYGFYNSINKDRAYNATQISQIFDGIINDGVYQAWPTVYNSDGSKNSEATALNYLRVRATDGMQIILGPGRAWFNHTWTYNDSDEILNISPSDFQVDRIDVVALKVDTTVSIRENTIEIISGTPAENPEKPILEDSDTVFYHPLAYIKVKAGTTYITDSDIENAVGINDRTPFVTGILDHVTADKLLVQWQAEWDEYKVESRNGLEAWMADQKSDVETWESEQKAEFIAWMADQKSDYDDWFANLHYILDGDVAGHLQNEIEDIWEKEFNRYYEICNKNTHFERDEFGNVVLISSTDGDSVVQNTTIEKTESITTITTRVINGGDRYRKVVVIDGDDISQTYSKY